MTDKELDDLFSVMNKRQCILRGSLLLYKFRNVKNLKFIDIIEWY